MSIILSLILITSFAGTFLILKIAVRKNILDIPNIRSSHTQPTPRGGGLAIVISWYIGLAALRYIGMIESDLFFALLSGAVLATISFLDDLFDIKPGLRILFQIVTVMSGLFFIGGFKVIYLSGTILNYPVILTFLAILGGIWFINLFNFLDGIDAYASTETLLVALGMLLVLNNPVLLILIFAVMGFLFWNWPKAKIFMGDIGSTQLGYILLILAIYFNNQFKFNFLGWLILTSLFWVDATLTLFKRWRNKENLSQAHRKHYYQRIVQYGFSHRKTVIISILINIVFVILVLLSEKGILSYFISFPVCLLINVILVKAIDNKIPFKSV